MLPGTGNDKTKAGKRKAKVQNGNHIRRRATKRSTAGTITTEKVKKTYKTDGNGCQHDNPDFWQSASSQYSNPCWRKKYKCRLSLKCSNCYKTV